jgi:anti-anti-sigma factor
MPTRPLEAHVRQRPGGAVVDLSGEIDGFAQDALNAAYAEAESRDPDVILLNFTGVDYINSTGIALIVGLLAKARAANRRILACGLSDHFQQIFDVTRLSDFMTVYPDEASALTGSSAPSSPR